MPIQSPILMHVAPHTAGDIVRECETHYSNLLLLFWISEALAPYAYKLFLYMLILRMIAYLFALFNEAVNS